MYGVIYHAKKKKLDLYVTKYNWIFIKAWGMISFSKKRKAYIFFLHALEKDKHNKEQGSKRN